MRENRQEEFGIVLSVEPDLEGGAFVASWDDPAGGIMTQASTLAGLVEALKEAVLPLRGRPPSFQSIFAVCPG